MATNLLLVGAQPDSEWVKILSRGLGSPYQLSAVTESESLRHIQDEDYALVIVDATAINNVESFVASLHQVKVTTPIVVMTACPTPQGARRAFLAGATDYLSKVLDIDELRATFEALLSGPGTR